MINMIDIDAHPPIEELARKDFYQALRSLGITQAMGAPLCENMTERECNLLAITQWDCHSLWGHPDCTDTLEHASLITVDSAWLPLVGDILRLAESRRIPVILQHETADEVRALANVYPTLPLIVGGLGSRIGKPSHMRELMRDIPRLYLNLSGAVWTYNYVMHEWLGMLPYNRILFGTAYPLANPASKLASLRWELRDTDKAIAEAILCGNARALCKEVLQ